MSAKDHDHDHDHHHHDEPSAPLPATPEHGYWKSLRELAGQAPWQLAPSTREFPPGADQPPPVDPMSRRNFFHLMGASMGLAGLGVASGCQRYEKEEIVPLARRPEDQTPSQTLQYATAFELGGVGHALLATSYEGRPIHLDGNPDHPFASGPIVPNTKAHAGAHTFAQASILHLYDPDRAQTVMRGSNATSMDAFKASLVDLRKAIAAGGAYVLSEATSSPTVQALRGKLGGSVRWHEYEPISWDNERAGTKLAFGKPYRPLARLDKCSTIVTLDCDIFVEHPAAMRYCRDYARGRRKDGTLVGNLNRMYSIESVFSNTGALADHRLALRSEFGLPFAMALDAALGGGSVAPASDFLKEDKVARFVAALVDELRRNKGKAVVIAGRRQPPEVHALVARINDLIGAVGKTLDYLEDPDPDRPSHLQAITALVQDMAQHKVQTLLILGGNPVYDAPADLDFASALGNVQTSVHLAEYPDETSAKCTWHVPRAHFLEAWGDVRSWDGTITLQQPLIAPLYGGLSTAEFLSALAGDELGGQQLVRQTHEAMHIGSWRQNVHDGYIANTALPIATPALAALPQFQPSPSQSSGSKRKNGELEVVFHYSSASYDGRFANNAWLWETPDFLTKVTWDTYALVSPETAETLNLENDTLITVKVGNKQVELPCYTMPGQARYSIGLVLGGGRTRAGHVTTHPHNVSEDKPGDMVVGFDSYKVRQTTGFDVATNCSVVGSSKRYELANIQDHWDYRPGILKDIGKDAIERRSPQLIRETTETAYDKNRLWEASDGGELYDDHELDDDQREYKPAAGDEFWDDKIVRGGEGKQPRHLSLFEEKKYAGHRWAMAIDLSTCTGCNACMVACQSENNVPVVGRREVINNREMHWIRIDRYFQGSPEDPHVVHQPLPCQQCENAPCEQVCPVGATSHSPEGLNDMAYNRCIGTRYCLNNCPYKVRRFNFLDWNKEFREAREQVRALLFNPDVTVRMRGVMEKCTYCVQRIQNAKIKWKAQHRNPNPSMTVAEGAVNDPLPDGTVETACQMACPTEAIVFGDLEDPNSRVSRLHADRRAYDLLPEMYTRPRTRYLARLRNLNPQLEPTAPAREGSR